MLLPLLLALSACESRSERLRDQLAAFDAEVVRLAWSCDAMAQGLGQWLDINESTMRDDALVVAEEIAALSDAEEAREALDDLAPPANPDARNALASCGEHAGVQRALARSADILAPLYRLDEPPLPPPPAPPSGAED